eukprot:TRINITY_DN8941_c0_g1_i1.p1 TRINITY_DN8941_c0_g1~~TRINITY_DN8941_c0_g1_i1.p1  ORF type:complete len:316 (+),score=77.56 TRINITY_DN8941_c0_g1_i1:101-1048(+)
MRRFMHMAKPRMSFGAVYMDGEYPTFFGWADGRRVAGSGSLSQDACQLETQLENLRTEGIRAVLCLTETPDDTAALEKHGLAALHLPVVDLTPPSIEQLAAGCRFIQAHVAKGEAVLVHCREGIGRTGTLLAAWLMWDGTAQSAAQAIALVRDARYNSVHKKCQEEQLATFERCLRTPTVRAALIDGTFAERFPEPSALELEPLPTVEPLAMDVILASPHVTSVTSVASPSYHFGSPTLRRVWAAPGSPFGLNSPARFVASPLKKSLRRRASALPVASTPRGLITPKVAPQTSRHSQALASPQAGFPRDQRGWCV